jgi:hypothetical protein
LIIKVKSVTSSLRQVLKDFPGGQISMSVAHQAPLAIVSGKSACDEYSLDIFGYCTLYHTVTSPAVFFKAYKTNLICLKLQQFITTWFEQSFIQIIT